MKPISEVLEFLRPIAEEVGVELIDAEWDMRTRSLTVYIDKEGGLDLVTCEKFHRAVDAPLDELDPTFGEEYRLNCSSPGLDRPFKKAQDFERHLGEKVEVHLYAPIHGKKYHEGELISFDGETVVIAGADGEKGFPFEKCSKVCLCIEIYIKNLTGV